jgi:transposase-like protein
MAQVDKKRRDAAQGDSAGETGPRCPNCDSAKTTVAGSVAGREWRRCDECGFNFSMDEEPRR